MHTERDHHTVGSGLSIDVFFTLCPDESRGNAAQKLPPGPTAPTHTHTHTCSSYSSEVLQTQLLIEQCLLPPDPHTHQYTHTYTHNAVVFALLLLQHCLCPDHNPVGGGGPLLAIRACSFIIADTHPPPRPPPPNHPQTPPKGCLSFTPSAPHTREVCCTTKGAQLAL